MRPPLACTNCRSRKKKCNRAYPVCSYCLKTHSRCSYRNSNNPIPSFRSLTTPVPTTRTENNLLGINPTAALFLDYSLLCQSQVLLSKSYFTINQELRSVLSNQAEQRECLKIFAHTIDPWMSFISPRELHTTLASPVSQLNGEDALLLACIQILVKPPTVDNPRSDRYLMIKSAFIDAEISDVISTRLLQALLLLLLYEFGHAIYPSAYFTLGTCIRILASLGIENSGPSYNEPGDWMDQELQRRLWWAVFVMERSMALGCPQRPLSMKEPDENKVLPSDDQSWEQEKPSGQPRITMTSPMTPNMGNFRLVAHASHLLGQVTQHVCDRDIQPQLYQGTTMQLYRTICSLVNVLEVEGQSPIVSVGLPRSILYSATMLLFPISSDVEAEMSRPKDDPHMVAASVFVERSRIFLQGRLSGLDQVSPFLLHWGFGSFRYYYRLYTLDGGRPETLEALKALEDTFHELEKRWKLVAAYTSLLYASQ